MRRTVISLSVLGVLFWLKVVSFIFACSISVITAHCESIWAMLDSRRERARDSNKLAVNELIIANF